MTCCFPCVDQVEKQKVVHANFLLFDKSCSDQWLAAQLKACGATALGRCTAHISAGVSVTNCQWTDSSRETTCTANKEKRPIFCGVDILSRDILSCNC